MAERTASGDLTCKVTYTAQDELGQLAVATNQMVSSLRDILFHIGKRAVTLAGASEELSSVSSQMIVSAEETSRQASIVSSGSEQMSRNMESVSVSVEEMIASIQEISKNTSEAAQVASIAATEAASTNTAVNKLGASSAEIGKVVQVINTIAQQTNLLALNAAIEAARAGGAGKGFAVVANEVKELAMETASATKDISLKIEAIQTDTTAAIHAIGKISDTIQQIKDISNSIATAIEQQLAASGEIGRNLSDASRGSTEISPASCAWRRSPRTRRAARRTRRRRRRTCRGSRPSCGELTLRFQYGEDQEPPAPARAPQVLRGRNVRASPRTIVSSRPPARHSAAPRKRERGAATMRALVVDDSRSMRSIITKQLKELGFEVFEADSGQEAMAKLHKTKGINLVLLDWNMPEMDGLEVLSLIRSEQEYKDVRVMMVTTESEMSQVAIALEAGASEYLDEALRPRSPLGEADPPGDGPSTRNI